MSGKGWLKLIGGCALALTFEVVSKLATDDLIQNIKDAKESRKLEEKENKEEA